MIKELKQFIETPKTLRQILKHFEYNSKIVDNFINISKKYNFQVTTKRTRWGYRTFYCSKKSPDWNETKGF